ncbi:XK-related protein 8-like [Solea senegalensis]|uniref:XK-related protein n=1 Tax=Solea senegalensis TaxID=28829 RepID=A0AAV6R457_SOLSE|nr:XK-related protein 8-like [Solea senegalensis]KAG7499820.1 XK-related protein 8-like [Solea senegalensis]
MAEFKYSRVDFILTCLGLAFLLVDIALDIFAVVSFYQEKEYVSLGILLFFLLGSSVLIQAFSWLFYSYENLKRFTKVEKSLSPCQLRLLHVFQLGIYIRHAGVVEMSVYSFFTKVCDPEGFAVFLSHDLSMLRLIETFSESSPQLVLMLTIILQRGQLNPETVLKAIGSAFAVALSVTMYHRSLRSFLPDKQNQGTKSSMMYFMWNLLLISSRLVALALFASVLPCFIFTHFLCSWLVLFFFAWRCKTDFMESTAGEWLFKGTVGLIWYFTWFNVVEGGTRIRTTLYHSYKLLDIFLLCSLWCWKTSTETSILCAICVVAVYILGLVLKVIYYKFYHPNLTKKALTGVTTDKSQTENGDEVDSSAIRRGVMSRTFIEEGPLEDTGVAEPPSAVHCNKRMRKLAANFYT